MNRTLLAGLFLCAGSILASAQEPDANTKAILDALKGINDRLDTIEGRIDTIEEAPDAAASGTAGATDDNPTPDIEKKDGWEAAAYLVKDGTVDPDALVYFTLPASEIRMNAHMAKTQTTDVVKYEAEAKFNSYDEGRYRFVIETTGTRRLTGCIGGLRIGKQNVVTIGSANAPAFVSDGLTLVGSADLEEGNYDITFETICQPTPRGGYSRPESMNTSWRDAAFKLLVRGPNERDLRALTGKEVFYYEKVN